MAERAAAAEAARTEAEEALRESERHQVEARTLRDSLASREATIAQVLHSLGERDAQLTALQQEHARVVPALEARAQERDAAGSGTGASPERSVDCNDCRAQATARLKRGESDVEVCAAPN